MPPITWRNVNAPSGGAGLAAFTRSGKNLGDAFKGLGENVQNVADDEQKRQTDDFVSALNALNTDEERNQLVQDANKAFLDIGRVNKSVTAAQTQDFKVNADKRATTLLDDNLVTSGLQQEKLQADLTESEDLRNNRKLLSDFSVSEAETKQKAAEAKIGFDADANTRAEQKSLEDTVAAEQRLKVFNQKQIDRVATENLRALNIAEKENTITVNRKNRADKKAIMRSIRLQSSGSHELDIKTFNEDQRRFKDAEVSAENLALTQTKLNSLVAKSSPTIEELDAQILAALELPSTADVSKIPAAEFTAEFKTALETDMANQLVKAFDGNLSFEQAKKAAEKFLRKNTVSATKFKSTRDAVDLKSKQNESLLASYLNRFDMNQADKDALDRNPGINITDRVLKRLDDRKSNLTPVEISRLSDSVHNVVNKIQGALGNLSADGRENLNLAILDMLEKVRFDKDKLLFNRNDFVLPLIDDETNIDSLNITQLLQGLTRGLPKGNPISIAVEEILQGQSPLDRAANRAPATIQGAIPQGDVQGALSQLLQPNGGDPNSQQLSDAEVQQLIEENQRRNSRGGNVQQQRNLFRNN